MPDDIYGVDERMSSGRDSASAAGHGGRGGETRPDGLGSFVTRARGPELLSLTR